MNAVVSNEPVFLDKEEAERFSKMCLNTLKRHHRKGVDTGFRKVGRRVLFDKAVLAAFLSGNPARLNSPAN